MKYEKIEDIIINIKKNIKNLNKEIGQNYLISIKILKKIVTLLDIQNNDDIFEAGSGLGNLSFFLLANKYKSITLNDIDKRNIIFLRKIIKNKKKINVIGRSVLKIDISKYSKIISNLPYYITHNLLEYFMIHGNALKYVFMVQKEVMKKINAGPNTYDYGPLNILMNYVGKIKKEFNVSRENFLPIPHVDSAVFSITKNFNNNDINRHEYIFFLKKMFAHRRKTIFNNLSLFLDNKFETERILQELKIIKTSRPNQIRQDVYLNIFKRIKSLNL